MVKEEFEKYVSESIDALPEWVHKKIQDVVFIVRIKPSVEELKVRGLSETDTLFGMYEGVPLAERGDEPPFCSDVITIFKNPIVKAHNSLDDIRACVSKMVRQEITRYIGLGNDWIEVGERRRGKTQ